ncbi:MAG: carboxyl-terminal processing protease [Parasphingorhabdus sp.]|jgi:carboxyl-terminal processing protease
MSIIPIYTSHLPALSLGFLLTLSGVGASYAQDNQQKLPIDELRIFSEVFGLIKNDYVEPVDDFDLLRSAIGGMLSGLDPHSAYLSAESFEEIQIGSEGRFGGLGIEVTMENGLIKVITPIDGTPAFHAGIKPGDIITRLDDTPVKGLSLDDAIKRMRGEPGAEIVLTILREGRGRPLRVTLKRAVIKISSVRGELIDEHYIYVRVTQFQANTASALRDTLQRLKSDADNSVYGLILDLRNNPGGVLSGAIQVSDLFLNSGTIVSTRGRNDESESSFDATRGDILNGEPIVLLVNGGSASASEIVAGALKDHHRAIILGSQTFGKGSVQTILPLKNGAALKITTARYYTPSGNSIQATGIDPDILSGDLVINEKEVDESRGRGLREEDLAGHLQNENNSDKTDENITGNTLNKDPLIREALNLLKGLFIISKAKQE